MASINSCALACNYFPISGVVECSSKAASVTCLKPSLSFGVVTNNTSRRLPLIKAQAQSSSQTAKATLICSPAAAYVTKDYLESCECVVKYGPYGDTTGQEWSLLLEPSDNIIEMNFKTGAVVDSIDFTTRSPTICGMADDRRKVGGSGGNPNPKIELQDGEYVTKISGSIGYWNKSGVGNVQAVAKLAIHTNLKPDGYGPYGGGPNTIYVTDFSSEIPSSGRVVGFFGTLIEAAESLYIRSIGVYFAQRE